MLESGRHMIFLSLSDHRNAYDQVDTFPNKETPYIISIKSGGADDAVAAIKQLPQLQNVHLEYLAGCMPCLQRAIEAPLLQATLSGSQATSLVAGLGDLLNYIECITDTTAATGESIAVTCNGGKVQSWALHCREVYVDVEYVPIAPRCIHHYN
eukprot:scaffold204756_cov25-Prasinocladus_malaysianus.AAC.1